MLFETCHLTNSWNRYICLPGYSPVSTSFTAQNKWIPLRGMPDATVPMLLIDVTQW